ncbi:MAG: ferritin-like domain-containing protein [Kineosporiaceae bacterium]
MVASSRCARDDPQLTGAPQEWRTVGHLHRGIETGLAHLVRRHGESSVFVGPPEAQAATDVFEWPGLTAVTDLASASAAIELIVEQGEGARGDWPESHFGRFIGILEDFLEVRRANPQFDPARPVTPAFVHAPPDVDDPVLVDDPQARRVADLFASVYEVVLQVQSRYFVHQGETREELDTLAKTVKHLMNWVMRELGPVLTSLPVGRTGPGRTVGPAFEIVRPSFFVLPHRRAAWLVLVERLDALGGVAHALAAAPTLAALGKVGDDLHGFAGDLERHLRDRGERPDRAAVTSGGRPGGWSLPGRPRA